jgi:putative CocE/NonD family hydrolase
MDSFRYNPADPTPSVGGRTMSMTSAGSRDNSSLEARADVLTFSSPVLTAPIEVAGTPSVQLHMASDNAHFDVFVRLCDVDERGVSRNLTDQIVRLTPDQAAAGSVTDVNIQLTDVSHVFLAGHRIRLQVSGGAHPRFARNLGTGADQAFSTAMVPANNQLLHGLEHPSALILPVVPAAAGQPGLARAAERSTA